MKSEICAKALELCVPYGRVHLSVGRSSAYLSFEDELSMDDSDELSAKLHKLGWRRDGWLERWEHVA